MRSPEESTTPSQASNRAPSDQHQHIFDAPHRVFYGTDDGFQDGSFGEFRAFESHYRETPAARRDAVHLVSAIGGLYGLNLIPLWRPKEITFFDINPHAIAYFRLIARAWAASADKTDFLNRLSHEDYPAENDDERLIRENIALKQKGALPPERGSSKRSFESSWRYALDRFELTKSILASAPVRIRPEGMQSKSFQEFVFDRPNVWIYCTNIFEFVYFKLRFRRPTNVVLLSMIYPGQPDLLDLSSLGRDLVEVQCEIPMAVRRPREFKLVFPEEIPAPNADAALAPR